MLRRVVTSGLFCTLVLLVCAARAEACTCGGPDSACMSFGYASAVFVGTVTEVKNIRQDAGQGSFYMRREATFLVEEKFSGVEGTSVSIATGSGGGDCGYNFVKGTSYLVYAYRSKESEPLSTGICSRTRPSASAAEDLEYLRARARQPGGVTISGRVGRPLGRDDYGAFKLNPLEGVRVTISGRAGPRDVLTDEQGRYKLSGLPPGPYEVTAHLPDNLTAGEPRQIKYVADRGCGIADFQVMDNGRIRGRVLDAEGRAVPNVTVTLVEFEDEKSEPKYGTHVQTDAEGLYKFTGLQPGRYLFGVRVVAYTAVDDPATAFPRTFYPGVAQATEAEVLELKTGEELTLRDLRLPPRLAESVIRIRVLWDDGSPVPNANVLFREMTYGETRIDHGAPADAQGQFEIKSRIGTVFRIHATTQLTPASERPGAETLLRAESQTLTIASPVELVTLVITKPK